MPSSHARAPVDPRAFIAWENKRKARYELIAGEVRMMAGGSRAHDLIAGNTLVALRRAIRRSGCDVHGSNLKVVSPVGMVTYPDLFVRCGPLADEATECDDPVVVVEVLSPSTRSEDLVRKRWGYQAIPSVRHLVYVDAARLKVELVTRDEGGRWWSEFLDDPGARLDLPAVGANVALADVYAGTGAAR
jgi:Uma2 family endonuclease